MDGIENAIRNALAKGDDGDPAFRERVYRQAFAALERALKQSPDATVEAAIRRKQDLQAKIVEIEQQYIAPQTAGAAPELDMFERGAGPRDTAPNLDVAPGRRDGGSAPDLGAADRRSRPPVEDDLPRAEERPVPGRRRRPWASLFVLAVLVAAAIIGYWWLAGSGLLAPVERDTAAQQTPPAAEEQGSEPGGATQAPALPSAPDTERDWITVFDPADPTSVEATGGASAEVLQEEGETFLRIRSASAEDAVRFDVGQGILEEIAGRTAVFVIDTRSEENQATQISVECDFGALGDCGRKRYLVGQERSGFLFEVELPEESPDAGGTIAVNSDIEGQGRAIDIFGIRVAVEE